MDFGREPIGMFTVQVGIQASIASKYYSGIDTSNKLTIDVNPALLSRYTGSKDDKLWLLLLLFAIILTIIYNAEPMDWTVGTQAAAIHAQTVSEVYE